MKCNLDVPDEIRDQFSKLKRKDPVLFERVIRKIDEILENPVKMGSPKKYHLAGTRGVHVGHFVLLWLPIPPVNPHTVKIVLFEHHDGAYR